MPDREWELNKPVKSVEVFRKKYPSVKRGFGWSGHTCRHAAGNGHFETLKHLHKNQCLWDEETCARAAKKDICNVSDVPMTMAVHGINRQAQELLVLGMRWNSLQCAHTNGCPWDECTCTSAAGVGHLNIIQCARANGCPWHECTCASANGGWHWGIRQCARTNGCEWDSDTWFRAAQNGHLDILKCAHDHQNGCPWDEETCAQAAGNGHLECLQCAHENNCPWTYLTCTVAAGNMGIWNV